MLKNFCFCSTSSASSFNYSTLPQKQPSTIIAGHVSRRTGEEKSCHIEQKLAAAKKPPVAVSAVANNEDYVSTYRSNSNSAVYSNKSLSNATVNIDDSAGSNNGAFTFLSTSTTTTTSSSIASNSIHFYHPKSIHPTPNHTATNLSTTKSSDFFSSSVTTTTTSSSNNSHSNTLDKISHSQQQTVPTIQTNSGGHHHNQMNISKTLVSNLTPLSETPPGQLMMPRGGGHMGIGNKVAAAHINKENLKVKVNDNTSGSGNKNLVTSTTIINLRPSLPTSQPPSLDSKKFNSRFNLIENVSATNNIIMDLNNSTTENKSTVNSMNSGFRRKKLSVSRNNASFDCML
jgi:hypothetical protein